MAKVFVIVGGNHSGKDEIIRAVQDLAGLHAQAVSKFTSRPRQEDDGAEMCCDCSFTEYEAGKYKVRTPNAEEYDCDISYRKNCKQYGIDTHQIWKGLRQQKFQVIVVSEKEAINKLVEKFGSLVKLIYVHGMDDEEALPEFHMFIENFAQFDHVLIAESKKEDLYDQLFRLFRAYEQ